MHYMYDDPPKEDNFVNPYYRNHRQPLFKTDTQDWDQNYLNPGHLMNPNRKEFAAKQQARVYTEWEPPSGHEARDGKKILMEKPRNDGRAF